MDVKNQRQYIFNLQLAKQAGLYQILDSDSFTVRGFNIYHVVIWIFELYLIFILTFIPFGLHHLRNDIVACVLYVGCTSNFALSCYKITVILYNAKDIWRFVDVTRFSFLSYAHYNRGVFTKWRELSIRVSYLYMAVALFGLFTWISSPAVFNKTIISIRNTDGSYSKYRMNIFNVYLIASAETYNNYFYVFYFFEIIISFWFIYFTMIFDVLTIMMCFSFSCQLETINNAIESLGLNRSVHHLSTYKCLLLLLILRFFYRFTDYDLEYN